MYDKSFQDISDGKMELFGSFFSALKSFVAEMVLKGSKELSAIEMGDYSIIITAIKEITADLVVIADKDDQKAVNKLIPKVVKVLLKNKEIFIGWKGDRDVFIILDQPFSDLVYASKKLIGDTSLIDNPEEFLKSMWAHKGELTPEIINSLNQEKDILLQNFDSTLNLNAKLAINGRLLQIHENLRDDANFIKNQNEKKRINDEIKDVKLKLRYYLEKIKENLSMAVRGNLALKKGDYKDAYLSLYSFSSKLKLLAPGDDWKNFRELANVLINKDKYEEHELSVAISKILKMHDDIEDYIN